MRKKTILTLLLFVVGAVAFFSSNMFQTFPFLNANSRVQNSKSDKFFSQIQTPFNFTILHTNDLHSAFLGKGPDSLFTAFPDGDPVVGGYSRLATLIQREREAKQRKGEPVLLIDSGDFYAGSLFHTLAVSQKSLLVPELDFFSRMKYDAVTLGNHEFDAGEIGLYRMLKKAQTAGLSVPIVLSNEKKDSFLKMFTVSYVEKQISPQVTACIFGALGPDAAFASANERQTVSFAGFESGRKEMNELLERLANVVKEAQKISNCQLKILSFHGGNPEDETIAKTNLFHIILSGHTHETYLKKIGNTYVMQSGAQGAHLGKMELVVSSQGLALKSEINPKSNPWLLNVLDNIPGDTEIQAFVESAQIELSKLLQAESKTPFDQKIVYIQKSLKGSNQYPNNPLGGVLFEKVRVAASRCQQEPIDIYFSTKSLVRSDFSLPQSTPTWYQYSDIFRIFSIGFDENLEPGNSAFEFYFTKDDFKKLLEFFEVYRYVSPLATPAISENVNYKIRSWGFPFFNRVNNLNWNKKPFETWPPLLHVATNEIILKNLEKISNLSRGFVNIQTRNNLGEVAPAKKLKCKANREHELLAEELQLHGIE
jgi:2',3'-cyclic-nucleotide 2'-phosphodiesterase (5'-nucleotidase family)